MPTYDYECSACDATYELFQQITEKPKKKCQECGERKAQRLIGTGGAVIFKGSGFYQTDYRSSEYKSKQDAENKSKSDSTATKTKAKDGAKTKKEPAKAATKKKKES